jgi:NADH-quinone oxidoreductase subunit G
VSNGEGEGAGVTDVKKDTVTITVDGREIETRPGELLIAAAEHNGIYIPRFCWHSRMDPVGACRMCLVDIEGSPPIPGTQQRRPQTSCTTTVRDGMVVHTQFTSEEVNQAQKTILELLLINHPLDCPICDRGGECPLQDQTQDYGPAESRFIEPKRRYRKPVPISPLVNLDRERCILCYRCTRFCEELSGDALIGVMDRGPEAFIFPFYSFEGEPNGHDGVRGPDDADINETFDSYFSGNTIQICPVGALTSREYRFMARPWDLQVVASTCNLCASGCSLNVGVRVQDGNVARFSAATNEDTNEEWLCDRGRFGNAYISAPERLTQPLARRDGNLVEITWDEAFRILRERMTPMLDGGRAGVICGESLCDEDYYTAQKFARCVLQTNNVDHRLEGGMSADCLLPPQLTYDAVLGSDLVVLVSLDAREELPILYLRLRIAATKRGLPIAIVHPREVALSEYATVRVAPPPGEETSAVVDAALRRALDAAERPVILLGPRIAADDDAMRAWFALATETGARVTWAPRRANSYGALAAGAHPALLPGWRRIVDDAARGLVADAWGPDVSHEPGLDAAGMLRAAANGDLDTLWLVGADVLGDIPDARLGAEAMAQAKFVVVQDVQRSPLVNDADLVFPAATFVERDGTLTDWEGRRQRVRAAVDPPGSARADYANLAESARRLGRSIGCRTAADAGAELGGFLESAAVWPQMPTEAPPAPESKTAGLRLLTYRLLYDDGSRIRRTKGIRELTPGAFAEMSAVDAQRLGVVDGGHVIVSSEHGSLRLKARVSDGICAGGVFVPWSQWGVTAQVLCAVGDTTPLVTVEPA